MGDWFYYSDKVGYISSTISRVGFMAGKVKIRVTIVLILVLILVKLFLRR